MIKVKGKIEEDILRQQQLIAWYREYQKKQTPPRAPELGFMQDLPDILGLMLVCAGGVMGWLSLAWNWRLLPAMMTALGVSSVAGVLCARRMHRNNERQQAKYERRLREYDAREVCRTETQAQLMHTLKALQTMREQLLM